jgi:dipeptidyl aminopeptidase/acylaminoacyl peptidase
MMPTDRFERQLPELLNDLAEPRTPDYFDDLLWQTEHTSQRPAWTLLERWIPMLDITMSRVQAPRGLRYVVMLGILALAAAVALAIVGSRPRVPPETGLAANGVIAFTTAGGDIAVADPFGGETTTIVGGPELDSSPMFSQDGSRIAFIRKVEEMVRVFAVDAAGGTPRELTSVALPAASWLQWSPDGSQLAWLSEGSLWVAASDGSGAHPLDIDMIVREQIAWRPNGSELVMKGLPPGMAAYGLFLVRSDGTNLRAITALDGASQDYLWVTWSPDGGQIAYSTWPFGRSDPEKVTQSHVLTIDGLTDVVIEPDDGSKLFSPAWSPDGTRMAFIVQGKGIGIGPAGERSPHLTMTKPSFAGTIDFVWSSDGNTILAVPSGTGDPWLMDPAGGPGTQVHWNFADFPRNHASWSHWQRLAP